MNTKESKSRYFKILIAEKQLKWRNLSEKKNMTYTEETDFSSKIIENRRK